jgi:hypothetical protein
VLQCRAARPYSPECVEESFSEVRGSKLGRSGRGLGAWTGAERGFVARGRHAGRIRGLDSLRAVAACYVRTSRKFHQGVGQIP